MTDANGGEAQCQYSALCYRIVDGAPQVLLVTTRGSGRWIVPKGWPMPGRTPAETAAREAWEEAGVIGTVTDRCLGLFGYDKVIDGRSVACVARVFPVQVLMLADAFPEKGQRRRRWFSPAEAAGRVAEPELAAILRSVGAVLPSLAAAAG
ncbi:MAG: NUDIX hydrolase [Jhaorihella sp.]